MRPLALVLATSTAAVACGSSDSPGGPTRVPTTISVAPSPVRIPQFGAQQVTVAILDQQGDTIPDRQPTFATDFGAPITVSQAGLVTSLGPARTTHFTVRSGGALLQVPVEVIPIPESFGNLPPISKLGSGGYFPFQRPVVRDVLGDTIPDAPVTVTATPSILEVTTSGYLHSLGPLGAAFLILSSSNEAGQAVDSVPLTVTRYASPTGRITRRVPGGLPLYGVAVTRTGGYASTLVGGGPLVTFALPAVGFGPPVPDIGAGLGVAVDSINGKAYMALMETGSVAVVNIPQNTFLSYITDHIVGTGRDVIVSPDGRRAYVSVVNTEIYIVDTSLLTVVDSIYLPAYGSHFAFHPTAPLFYTNSNDGVAEISTVLDTTIRTLPAGGQGLAIAPDGSELYNVTESNWLSVVNLTTGNLVAAVQGLGGFGLVATPDGSKLLVSGSQNVKIINRATRTLIDSIVVGGVARRIALSPDGGTAFVANEGGWIDVIY